MSSDLHSDDDGSAQAVTFLMLDANFVRQFSGNSLPFFQEIRDKYIAVEPLIEVSLDYADVVKGTHIETTLAVSHRWMQPDDPDPDGEQLKALKSFLNSPKGKKIERVWIDSACMPQDLPKGSRSAEDSAAFKGMLKEVNRLYLGTTVLILVDLSYVSRFWTQFESWLAMQFAMPGGLKPAVGTKNERHHIICIQNAASQAELFKKALIDMWAAKTPEQAYAFLSKPDVTVTNQSDKEGQLPKIKALNSTVQAAFSEVARQIENELAASESAAARAEAELTAWETENDAKAGEGNRLKVKARQAASAVVANRVAKEKHEKAISSGLVPVLVQRDLQEKEAAKAEEEELRCLAAKAEEEGDSLAEARALWQAKHASARGASLPPTVPAALPTATLSDEWPSIPAPRPLEMETSVESSSAAGGGPAIRPPPTGAPPGGDFAMVPYCGIVTCCCTLCIPIACCCPCDQKEVYIAPDGQAYTLSGVKTVYGPCACGE